MISVFKFNRLRPRNQEGWAIPQENVGVEAKESEKYYVAANAATTQGRMG
jgi:hypothetical protein